MGASNTLVSLPESKRLRKLTHGIEDDFDHFVTGDRFSATLTDSGTATVGDAVGGILAIAASDGTEADNDEGYVATNEIFKIADAKPIAFESRVQFAEANTDDANILVGLMDGVAANALQDDGAGPKASYSGACFFKADGDTLWSVEYSNGATQQTKQLTADNSLTGDAYTAGGSAYQTLSIEIAPQGSGTCDVMFWIDDECVAKFKDQSYSSATEMAAALGVKNGGANGETLNCDYISCYQTR